MLRPPGARRGWVLAATLAGLVLALAEGGSFLAVRHLAAAGQIVARWDPWNAFSGLRREQLDWYYHVRFDPRLGWTGRRGAPSESGGEGTLKWASQIDAEGARYNALFPNSREIAIATYGDSFTFGSEVNDEETWQFAMSERLGRYVANYGVGAYGVDQAILRYELEPPPGPAPFHVVLAVFPGDLDRALTRWMAYLARREWAALLFKPRFRLAEGALRLEPLPFEQPIHDLAALDGHARRLRWDDPWYARQVGLAPPWSYRMARIALNTVADRLSVDIPWFGIVPADVWASPSARALMHALVDRFVALARARGSAPVLFFLDFPEIVGPPSPALAAFIAALRDRLRAERVPVLTLSDPRLDRRRLAWRPGGHLAPRGNKAVADFLVEALAPAAR